MEHKQCLEIRLRGEKERGLDTACVLGTKLRTMGTLPQQSWKAVERFGNTSQGP